MVAFEMSLLLKQMSRSATVEAVKRMTSTILEEGGHIQRIEYLGNHALPYFIKNQMNEIMKGSYFTLYYHAPYETKYPIMEYGRRDFSVLRQTTEVMESGQKEQCLLHEETLPPMYRSDVKKMIKEAEERKPFRVIQSLKRKQGPQRVVYTPIT